MSQPLPWRERLEAALENPILSKELLGAFRRRRFLYLLCGLLGAAGLLLAGALLTADPDLDASVVGRQAFGAFVTLEALIVTLVFPAFSCVSIVEERSNDRFDLLITTRLRPNQIARGKLGAALIYGGTFLIGTLPLVALTFLYGGVGVGQITLAYASLCLLALIVTTHGLAMSGLTSSAPRAVAGTFITLPLTLLVTGLPAFCLWIGPFLYGPLSEDIGWIGWGETLLRADPIDQGLAVAVPLLWALGWVWLGLTVAGNGLQSESGDRSTPVRIWFLGVWTPFLALGAFFLAIHPPPADKPTLLASSLEVFFGVACLAFTSGAVYFATGRVDPLARPLIGWRRLVGRGPWSGAGFILLVALASYVTAVVIVTLVPDLSHLLQRGSRRLPLEVLLWGTLWSLAFLLAVTQGGVWLSRRIAPSLARASLFAIVLTLTSVPAVVWAFAPPREGGSLLQGTIFSPITVLRSITIEPHLADRRLLLFVREPELRQGMTPRQRARALRLEATEGVEVHRISAALYFGLGLFLFFLNARAFDPDEPARESTAAPSLASGPPEPLDGGGELPQGRSESAAEPPAAPGGEPEDPPPSESRANSADPQLPLVVPAAPGAETVPLPIVPTETLPPGSVEEPAESSDSLEEPAESPDSLEEPAESPDSLEEPAGTPSDAVGELAESKGAVDRPTEPANPHEEPEPVDTSPELAGPEGDDFVQPIRRDD
ncbi:MAG: hypothetical protein JKY65_24630 [Planctomycetes bacterium]|nr:hypothetical protein [Planctomycetota bacterium]